MIVGEKEFVEAILAGVADLEVQGTDEAVLIQSPVMMDEAGDGDFVEVFPLWLEYYGFRGWLNRPWKVMALGVEDEFRRLPYYVTLCLEGNTFEQIDRLLNTEKIDYSEIPDKCSGRDMVASFFYGHGSANIRGILGKIVYYIKTGIIQLRDGDDLGDVSEHFFSKAEEQLEKLKSRMVRYQGILEFLPWKDEIGAIDLAINIVDAFLREPGLGGEPEKDVVEPVERSFDGLLELMKVHHIPERDET